VLRGVPPGTNEVELLKRKKKRGEAAILFRSPASFIPKKVEGWVSGFNTKEGEKVKHSSEITASYYRD